MYRILLLVAILTVSTASECLHHVCLATFKACNNTPHHDTQKCLDWADETFHCCDECESCDTSSKHEEAAIGDNECHPHLCDTLFNMCNRVHSNSSDCLERADYAAHCCYSCLDCPSADRAQFNVVKRSRAKSDYYCSPKLCNVVYGACTETHHTPQECVRIADDVSDCCEACNTCASFESFEHECHAHTCKKIFDICNDGNQNSTECWERADVASHCCYDCMDCPSNVKPAQPKYDHCLSDLCDDVYENCIDSEHSPSSCRKLADHASGCCNMCDECHK